jgi:hypothetical protein
LPGLVKEHVKGMTCTLKWCDSLDKKTSIKRRYLYELTKENMN